MSEQSTLQLERSPTASSVAPQPGVVVPAPDGRGSRRQRRGSQSVDHTCSRRRGRRTSTSAIPWGALSVHQRPVRSRTGAATARPQVDQAADRHRRSPRVWHFLASHAHQPLVPGDLLDSSKARAARAAMSRGRHRPVARRHRVRHQQAAQAQPQYLFCIDESELLSLTEGRPHRSPRGADTGSAGLVDPRLPSCDECGLA